MSKQQITTIHAPTAIGTYSQAIQHGNTVYISGQIPLLPATSALVIGDIDTQIRQTFNNLQALTQAAGGNLNDIVKLNVFLVDLNNFSVVNKIMAEYFSEPYPARSVVGVAALPKGAEIEIDAVMSNRNYLPHPNLYLTGEGVNKVLVHFDF